MKGWQDVYPSAPDPFMSSAEKVKTTLSIALSNDDHLSLM